MHFSAPFILGLIATALAAPAPIELTNDQLNDFIPRSHITADGEETTIWVHKAWKRAQQVQVMGEFASTSTANKRCGTSSFVSDTASDSAYTGGCHAIREWAEANPGFWDLPSGNMKILVYGGSNSGANCVFAAQRGTDVTSSPRIGNTDVADFLRGSHSRFATFFNGAQRLAAHGSTVCSGVDSVERGVDWYIFPTARIV